MTYSRCALTAAVFAASSAILTSSMFAGGELKRIPLTQIRANPVALRSVDKDSEEYKGLVASIRSAGVLNAVNVREKIDSETNQPYYELVDGLHRFSASCDAGQRNDGAAITDIPAQVITADDAQVLELQLQANIHKVETKPAEYSKQLIRILKINPTMTETELAVKLGKSPSWLNERLKLVRLTPEAAQLVDGGQIVLANAYALAALPKDEQLEWLPRAQTLPTAEFTAQASNRVKELDKAMRAGRAANPEAFSDHPIFKKMSEVVAESNGPSAVATLVNKYANGDPMLAAQIALQWALSRDADSLAIRRAKWESDKKRQNEDRAKRAADRKDQRAKDAEARAAKYKDEANKARQEVGASA